MEHFKALLENSQLTPSTLWQIAKDKRFVVRAPLKITPVNFLHIALAESLRAEPSYNDMAARLDAETGISASRQAFCKRVNDECVAFMQTVLATIMKKRFQTTVSSTPYDRILVQDSTVIRLPERLYEEFSGVSNGHSAVCNARLQVIYDLLAGEFVSFSIDPYSKNDSSSAPETELCENDLVLRDRGYLSADEFRRHLDAGADCIYRHKHNTTYTDPQTGCPIDLIKELRQHGKLDREVQLSNPAGTVCRLVAAPVDEQIGEQEK